ncbi:MAG TPA: beta-galactosidase [Candidatus Saccharimonadales bacterium]|nr:beta-galactosidase [Candidatus Saccharimonadales bacterium]
MAKRSQSYTAWLTKSLNNAAHWCCQFWHRNWWNKLLTIIVAIVIVMVGAMYGIAEWYIHSQADKPLEQGVSFIPDYAQSLGLDPQQTMDSLLDINVRYFRMTSYWSDMEPTPGHYDFSQLDWEFKKAETKHAKVILTVGLRQPRWPECHSPSWIDTSKPTGEWQPQLESFMRAVIDRYKNSPSLESYQLENEYFLKGFGECTDYSRQRLIDEYNLVKRTDPGHPVIIGRSNNSLGFPTGQPQPDEFSISVYKRVWDAGVTHRYLEYPQPAWFYGFLAGTQKIFLHKNMMIGELQAEAWPPRGQTIQETSLSEQNKSLDAKRLKDRFQYGRATGMHQIYLWGGEYWYYRMVKLHDPSLWNVARQEFKAD